MEVCEAINEFANLLSVGSTALARLIEQEQPAERVELNRLLDEVAIIASRIRDIASEIGQLG